MAREITKCIKELFRFRELCNKVDKIAVLTLEEQIEFLALYYKYKKVIYFSKK